MQTILERDSDKRVFSRVPCLVDLEVQEEKPTASPPETVEAVDLSLLGVGFERPDGSSTSSAYNLGDTLTVGMYGLAPIRAQVRWNNGSRVGVQFCGRFHDIMDSWVGEVLAAQGVTIQDLFRN